MSGGAVSLKKKQSEGDLGIVSNEVVAHIRSLFKHVTGERPAEADAVEGCFIFEAWIVEGHFFFFFQAEDGIRDFHVTGVQTCALPISSSVAVGGNSPTMRPS